MDIASWLRGLGLEQYEQAFRDNAIDAEILPELTEGDLEKLGVLLGHRKRLLKAIAALQKPRAERDGGVPVSAGPAPSGGRPARSAAERRQLTVLFCDLIGSTELAAKLDPEDLREIISAYQRCVAEVIARFEGHVAKYMGDGVLAYFGYPLAHEDEAERAVRAALDLIGAMQRPALRNDHPLQVRVGIATGLVVVGDLIGEGAAKGEVIGETPNLAARLQTLAEPGSVVISRRTRRLIGGLFELADLGAQRLKGFAEPVRAWRVLGPSRAEDRFAALHETGLTPLVGREHELALLLDRWERAKEGEGQVVLLSGEPGIGKSRLIRALRERLAEEPHTPLSHFCSPYHRNTAFHPIIALLERAAGISREDPPGEQCDKLEALLAPAVEDVGAVAPLFADLLAIPTGDRYSSLDLTPQQRKQRTLDALLGQLSGLAAKRPVLSLYEDVHWMDPSTLELVGLVIDRVQRLPVLVIITFRPEFAPPWAGHAHVTALSLSRLGRRQGTAMIDRVTAGKALPEDVLDQIIAKTDGVPLFVEELTKTVLESGLLRDAGDHFELTGSLPPLAIPATLHDSLMARLDRLAPVKEVAQIGAAIGREFTHELLAAVAGLPEAELQHATDQLLAAGLVFRSGTGEQASYIFKHALVQDAAYGSLLISRRQQLHARIAQILEERHPEAVKAQPELVARHYENAGIVETAVEYWQRAAERASARWAMAEAIAQLRRCLGLLAGLPDTPGRRWRELTIQVLLCQPLAECKGYAAPETGAALTRARELCREFGETRQLSPVLYGLGLFRIVRADLQGGLDAAEELLQLAGAQDDAAALMNGHRLAGMAMLYLGRLEPARTHLERAFGLYRPEQHASLTALYGHDPRVSTLGILSWALFLLGLPDQAIMRNREALDQGQRMGHAGSLPPVLRSACYIHQFRRDGRAVLEQAEALLSVADKHGFAYWAAVATIFRGWALADIGAKEEGLAHLGSGLAALAATQAAVALPYFLALMAEACAKCGRYADALALLSEAIDKAERSGERWFMPELHRLRGEALLALPAREEEGAEAGFRSALAMARDQGAKIWELRAAASCARLWAGRGERRRAYGLLAPVCGWFTEGMDLPDLRNAKALLGELG